MATIVRQYNQPEASTDPNHLHLQTYPSPMNDGTSVAQLTWVRHNPECRGRGDVAVLFTILMDRELVGEGDALRRAVAYADANGIPIIFHERTR